MAYTICACTLECRVLKWKIDLTDESVHRDLNFIPRWKMKVVTNDGVYFVRLGRYTYLPIRYYRDYRFLIQNQILN